MTKKMFLIGISLLGLIYSCKKSDSEIINQTISQLNSLKTIEYQSIVHCLQKNMNMDRTDSAICYFDFTSNDTLLKAKYQFIHRVGEQVFNGIQAFYSDNSEKRISYMVKPTMYDVNSSIFIINSIYTVRKLLPEMSKDTSILFTRLNDTIIGNQDSYLFSVVMKNKIIDYNEGCKITKSKKGLSYLLSISKKSFLPTQFEWIIPENNGYLRNSFSNFNISAQKADSVWSYDRFPKEYIRLSKKEFFESLRNKASVCIGQQAPAWTLPMINGDSINLSKQKGKLVLLEFWFPYCSGCVQSIPHFNEIQKAFGKKGLKVFGIEFTQKDEPFLKTYIEKQKIEYPTLHLGKQVAKEYGVTVAPTIFLIDKSGKIVYSSLGLKNDDLISAINQHL